MNPRKPYQHPIGYGAPDERRIARFTTRMRTGSTPQIRISPATSCGTGNPTCKVNVNDSDHSYFGMWNDTPQENRNYAWQNFMTGNQVLFMDPYLVYYPREGRNMCVSPVNGICSGPDPRWDNFQAESWIHFEIFPQVESCQCHSAKIPLFNGILSCTDPRQRCGVSGLCPVGRPVHDRPLGHGQFADIGGRVVQPVHWIDYRRRAHSIRIILAIIHTAVQRRRGTVLDGYSWPRSRESKAPLILSQCVHRAAALPAAMPRVDASGLPVRLGLTAGEVNDNRLSSLLLTGLRPRTMLLQTGLEAIWYGEDRSMSTGAGTIADRGSRRSGHSSQVLTSTRISAIPQGSAGIRQLEHPELAHEARGQVSTPMLSPEALASVYSSVGRLEDREE